MSEKQSEALELADLLQPMMYAVCHNAAIELRRLAEYEQWYEDQVDENNRLRSELEAARGKVDDLEIQNASLESEVFHLSTLCDEQRAILVDVEMECGTDAYGAEFEDGDSKIIDRVRAHLAMLTAPTPNPQSPTTQPSE